MCCRKIYQLTLLLSECSVSINTLGYYLFDNHPHSFLIKNFSPTVDFGLYHSEEGPPDAEHAGISVNILQPGVREGLSIPKHCPLPWVLLS